MTEAKLAPNLPDWMLEHAKRYISSGGTDGHMYKISQPGRPEMTVPSLAADDDRPEVRGEVHLPAVLREGGRQLHRRRVEGRCARAPRWYRNILANADVEVQVGTLKTKARARTATGEERARLWEKSLEFWPPYADYERKTEREIPVVVLDPVALSRRIVSAGSSLGREVGCVSHAADASRNPWRMAARSAVVARESGERLPRTTCRASCRQRSH